MNLNNKQKKAVKFFKIFLAHLKNRNLNSYNNIVLNKQYLLDEPLKYACIFAEISGKERKEIINIAEKSNYWI